MMPTTRAYTTTGAKDPLPLDYLPESMITAAATLAGGATTVAFAVQVTLDNVFEPADADYVAPASARWFSPSGAPTTANGFVTFSGPWRAIRLNLTALDAGSIVFQVAQSTGDRA